VQQYRHEPRILGFPLSEAVLREMRRIGVDEAGMGRMVPKARLLIILLKNLSRIQCNLLKQHCLSAGADLAIAHGIANEALESSDGLLIATLKQLEKLLSSMSQPLGNLAGIKQEISDVLKRYERESFSVRFPGGLLELAEIPRIMGVLNVTPDSFYDGGKHFQKEKALEAALQMEKAGAAVIDVGGQSSRPGSEEIPVEEEVRRAVPVIESLAGKTKALISIDTYRAEVARRALDAGAGMVNDITALRGDPEMARLVAERGVPLVLMHIKGTPKTMQENPTYSDLMTEITAYLREGIQIATSAGIDEEGIIVDPGIGFGKTVEHNLEILRRLSELRSLGRPILVGPSRKSFIGKITGKMPEGRLAGTAAAVAHCVLSGAKMIRVHDVEEMRDVALVAASISKAKVISGGTD